MIVDTSAIIAILRDEADAPTMALAMEQAETCRLSAVSYVEAAAVIDSAHDPVASRRFDDFIHEAGIVIESVTARQARIARDFGKGHHRAGLNFGDCFSYALARMAGEPLLFKGKDFRHTDIKAAVD
jgi:ribonuclease VapC